MKKIIVFLSLLLTVGFAVSAQDFSKLPTGKWLDQKWNAVWEFGANGITLSDTNGKLIFDFKDKMADFKVDASLSKVDISFSCAETHRSYKFSKATTNLDMDMEVLPTWLKEPYKVTMKLQK